MNNVNRLVFFGNERAVFIGDCSPAVRCSPHTSGLPLPSGLRTTWVHPATLKMKYCFSHLAPGEAVPCRLRNKAKAYKLNTGTNSVNCRGTALQKENDKQKHSFFRFLETKVRFSLEIAVLLFAVALMLRGCRCHHVYEQHGCTLQP